MCYGFDANPDKIEQAKKVYANDPGVKIIYGALTQKSGEEIDLVITTDWTPASSIGQPNPDFVHMKTGLLQTSLGANIRRVKYANNCRTLC
ncbi:MAG: hypothetical protein Q8M92_08685 [Candidatus Subteraquimicrobiales bacterium]|nr:hypothetical protein [Candidatus Subteraquimicrobiales bacterium]